MRSRRESSNKLYNTYLTRWLIYCNINGKHPIHPSVPEALEFLQSLLDDNVVSRGYSAIATARSALSSVVSIDGVKFGDHPAVRKFMKGVYNIVSPEPRYTNTWDPGVIIELFKTPDWYPAKDISILSLSQKLITLILLATGQRGQVIQALRLSNMKMSDDGVKFFLSNKYLKQGRLGYKPQVLHFKFFTSKKLCIARYLNVYLTRTAECRENIDNIFITTKKPYRAVSRDTISRWVKSVMSTAGLDISCFKPGSTRAAAASKAERNGMPLDDILRCGGWSRASTFQKWYSKEVVNSKPEIFMDSVFRT